MFKNALAESPSENLFSVGRVIEIYQSSERVRQQTVKFRAITTPLEAKRYAEEAFLCVTWSGITASSDASAIHSRLLSTHLVGLSTERLTMLWSQLQADEYTHVLSIDEWNTGLIVVVRIDYQKPGDDQAFARQLSNYYRDAYGVLTIGNIPEGIKPELDPASMALDWRCPIINCPEVFYNPTSQLQPLLAEYDSDVDQVKEFPVSQVKSTLKNANSLVASIQAERHRAEQEVNGDNTKNCTSHEQLMANLLEQVQKIDFRERAGFDPDDEDAKLRKEHYLVITVEEVLDLAKRNKWGLCQRNGSFYLFNGAYWKAIDRDEVKGFLQKAAEKMGADKFKARHFDFADQVFKQFMVSAHLPAPQANTSNVRINLSNCTLEIGEARNMVCQPEAADFMTYQLPFDFNPEAKASIW
jgi:hypothetical protein